MTSTEQLPMTSVLGAMRTFVLLVLTIATSLVTGVRPAMADEGLNDASTAIELTVEDVGNLGDLEAVIEETTKTQESRAEGETSAFNIEIGTATYRLPAPDDSLLGPFVRLGAKQTTFLDKRKFILTSTARALQMMKYGIGIGSVIGEKTTYITEKIRGKSGERKERRSLSVRAHGIIQALLQALDRKLWSSARVIADYNEVHFFIAPGVLAFGGKKTETGSGRVVTGWGGAYNLVLNFGFNREKRGLVFEIVREVEVFKDTVLPRVFMAGGAINLGLSFRVREDHALVDVGNRYKPPAAPLTTTDGERMLMISSGPAVTIPPPPFGDAITNTNELENAPLLRILISPKIKGWVHFHSDLLRIVKSDSRMTVDNVNKLAGAVGELASRIRGRQGGTCRSLFAQ